MIIRQHHFFDTYYSATGAKNTKLENEVILNEVANIIVARPDLAIANLLKAGININQDADEQQIADAYQENLYKPELAKLTADEIAVGNKSSFDGKDYSKPYYNGVGEESGGTDWGSLATSVANLGVAIGGAVKAKKDAKRAASEAKKAEKDTRLQDLVMQKKLMIENQIASLLNKKSSDRKKSDNKTLYIVMGVGAGLILIGSLVAYAVSKSKTAAPVTTA